MADAPHVSVSEPPSPLAPFAGALLPNAAGGCGGPPTVKAHHVPPSASKTPLAVCAGPASSRCRSPARSTPAPCRRRSATTCCHTCCCSSCPSTPSSPRRQRRPAQRHRAAQARCAVGRRQLRERSAPGGCRPRTPTTAAVRVGRAARVLRPHLPVVRSGRQAAERRRGRRPAAPTTCCRRCRWSCLTDLVAGGAARGAPRERRRTRQAGRAIRRRRLAERRWRPSCRPP